LDSFFGIKVSIFAESVNKDDSVFGYAFGISGFVIPHDHFDVGHGKVFNLEL
jgi:hypothetical protein